MPADLHIHTHYSDSTLSPEEVVDYAYQTGIKTIAITDHDVIDGIEETMQVAHGKGMEVIPAVELSVNINQGEIHILGYFIDWQDQWFNEQLLKFREKRLQRIELMLEKLKKQGINLDYNRIIELGGKGSIGRLHIAQVMYETGVVSSYQEAFTKYLGHHCPAYVKKFELSPQQAIEMIKQIKGIPVLAHPCISDCNGFIPDLVKMGLRGIEVYHPQQNLISQNYYTHLCYKYGLLQTGGSDCHGLRKGMIFIGQVKLQDELVEKLKEERYKGEVTFYDKY